MPESVETQVARLEEQIAGLRRDVNEVKDTLHEWIENTAKERLTIIMAFVAGWLSLMVAAVSAYLKK